MASVDDQQFCLRWNNFQANITSQFETLRDDEDFTDVTLACDGQRLQAHKVVLSACSPFFKELFKTNPCAHPIIFMRDVEARHVIALMEFMYAGEVNVAQAHLSAFLKTAESLKIRGLTDTSTNLGETQIRDTLFLNPQPSSKFATVSATQKHKLSGAKQISSSSTVTSSSQDGIAGPLTVSSPPTKRQCKSEGLGEVVMPKLRQLKEDAMNLNPFAIQNADVAKSVMLPKVELPDYDVSDDDARDDDISAFYATSDVTELAGGMEIIPQIASFAQKEVGPDLSTPSTVRLRKRRSADHWLPYESSSRQSDVFEDQSNNIPIRLRERKEGERRNRLIKLGEGIEIYEDQLRSVKWSDYRKLTRGLATILFSPAELATCSVTGQRWSRAGSGERPVKPALDRSKVQAIISYVATRFPMVEISRIKQVLAYKCKENSTAFKMKAVRYYEDQRPNK